MKELSRRGFLQTAAVAAAAGALKPSTSLGHSEPTGRAQGPLAIASANGLPATQKAIDLMRQGADTLDAAIAGVNIVEEDPNDHSVGYGGLPNEDGVVELDSCVMHGPSAGAGAVAALRNIKTPSRVARTVMQRTDHVLLVGEGALRFARAHGFEETQLLTDEARRIWLKWKESHSDRDDWITPTDATGPNQRSQRLSDFTYAYGTINCCTRNTNGDISGVTTTSGLSYKIPGRVGDSPIIGAGLFVDNEIGAAGSTGRGEAVIKICGAHTVVEAMRAGMSPQQACLHALKRIADKTKDQRLLRKDGRPNFDVRFYAVSKDGRYGAAAIWSGAKFAINTGDKNRHEDCAFLFERA